MLVGFGLALLLADEGRKAVVRCRRTWHLVNQAADRPIAG
jgi:hypothetical protein